MMSRRLKSRGLLRPTSEFSFCDFDVHCKLLYFLIELDMYIINTIDMLWYCK